MQDFLLLASAAMMFGFGWFIVKRLDVFLENNCQAKDGKVESDKSALQLGISNSSATDNMDYRHGGEVSLTEYQRDELAALKM